MATNITLNNTTVATAKFVRNGITTELTEIRYQKGASGTPVTVWTAQTVAAPYVSCTHSVVDRGSYYELTMVFTRTNTKFGNHTVVTVDASGTLLYTDSLKNLYSYGETILNFGTTSKRTTTTIKIYKTDVYSTNYAIKYTDSKAGEVVLTGQFPMTVISPNTQYEFPYLSSVTTSWTEMSGSERTNVTTTVLNPKTYAANIVLAYYVDGEYLGSSDAVRLPAHNGSFSTSSVSKTLSSWYGGSEITVVVESITPTSNLVFFEYPDEDYINTNLRKVVECTTIQTLVAPTVSVESVSGNEVRFNIADNNTSYSPITITGYKRLSSSSEESQIGQWGSASAGFSGSFTTTVEANTEYYFIARCTKPGFAPVESIMSYTLEAGDIDQDYKHWPRLLSITAEEAIVSNKLGTELHINFQKPSYSAATVNLVLEPDSSNPYHMETISVGPSGGGNTSETKHVILDFWIPQQYSRAPYTLKIESVTYNGTTSTTQDVAVNDPDFYNEYFKKDFTCTSDTALVAPEVTLEYYEGDSSNFINVIATNKVTNKYCPVWMRIYAKYLTTDEDYTYEQYFPFGFVEYNETQEWKIEIGNYEGAEIMVECYKPGFTSKPYTVETIGTLADGSNTESTRRE